MWQVNVEQYSPPYHLVYHTTIYYGLFNYPFHYRSGAAFLPGSDL